MELLGDRLAEVFKHGWWQLLLRGLAAIAFAVLIQLRPELSLPSMIHVFGVYALADGFLAIWTAIAGRKQSGSWWLLLLAGLFGVFIGVVTFMMPIVTAGMQGELLLLLYVEVWTIGQGVLAIVTAIRLRKESKSEFLLVLTGLAPLAYGALLVTTPGRARIIGLLLFQPFVFIYGVLLVMLALYACGRSASSLRPS